MTRRLLTLLGAGLLAIAAGACSGGTPSAEEATTQACDALAGAQSSVAVLAEGAEAEIDELREAGVELRDAVAEINEDIRETLDDETIDALERAHNEYRRALGGVEDQAGLDAVADDLAAAGTELQTRYDETVASLGCG